MRACVRVGGVGVWEGIRVWVCGRVYMCARACLHVFKVKCPPLLSRLLFCFLNRSIHICCLKVTATESPR